MRLRNFIAETMEDAIALVRQALGPDAIIISTHDAEDGTVRVTTAVEEPAPAPALRGQEPDVTDLLSDALAAHGVPAPLAEKILMASLTFDAEEALVALSGALAAVFVFAPVPDQGWRRPIVLVGPPGAGKTVTAAKLAARAVLAGRPVRLVTAAPVRAGAIEQLEAFARILKLRLHTVDGASRLASIAASASPDELVLIDSSGINPYSAADRRELAGLIAAAGAEPVLVMAAGGDAVDAIEMAWIFRDLGSTRMVVTRLDRTHRLGSLLAAAAGAKIAFAEVGVSPMIADGLVPCNPVALARRLLAQAAFSETLPIKKRGMS